MTTIEPQLVNAIGEHYQIKGPWEPLAATGIINFIFATKDVVLRIATDHPEGVCDAKTESVAAPVAYAAGVLSPQMLAFDDSHTMIDRPFSLWERIHGETLGLIAPKTSSMPNTWYGVGQQLAVLHSQVTTCPDPNGYLDQPIRETNYKVLLKQLVDTNCIMPTLAKEIGRLIETIRPEVEQPTATCFLHNDLYDMNIMCTQDDALLALIDWGDAGWGDPALDFVTIPLSVLSVTLEGYGPDATKRLGNTFKARVVWDKLHYCMKRRLKNPVYPLPVDQFRAFLQSNIKL